MQQVSEGTFFKKYMVAVFLRLHSPAKYILVGAGVWAGAARPGRYTRKPTQQYRGNISSAGLQVLTLDISQLCSQILNMFIPVFC